MEDARTIILSPNEAMGDALGVRHVLELFVETSGTRWAELAIRTWGRTPDLVIRVGVRPRTTVTAELDIDDSTHALLTVAGADPPAMRTLNLLAAALRRELQRHRLLAESALLRGALDASTAAVMIFGTSGAIVFANRPADELIARQTEEELVVTCNGDRPQPLFRLLCTMVGELLSGIDNQTRLERLVLSDGSEMTGQLSLLSTGQDGLGPVVLVALRQVTGPPDRRVDEYAGLHQLSPRERDVLRLLVQGLDTVGMADHLGISPHTVRDHLKNVFRKTSSRSRSELLSALTGGANHSPR